MSQNEVKLSVDPLPAFQARLSEKAKGVPVVKSVLVPGAHFCTLVKPALWPVKDWYQERLADFFNMMVEDGQVASTLATGAIQLASGGKIYMGLEGPVDLGPDHYANIFVMFHSPSTREELAARYGVHFFLLEGEVAPIPNWYDVSYAVGVRNGEIKTIAQALVEQAAKRE